MSVFRPYRGELELRLRSHPTSRRSPAIISRLTRDIVIVYQAINPAFSYQTQSNPRRVLTKPSKPFHNDGYDNEDSDYILYVNDLIGTQEGQQYQILDILGQGTFGQVVRCQNVKTRELVAVKVIKNKPAYYNQSLVEVAILEMLNNQYDSRDKHHIVRMMDTFVFRNHLCIVFEMLSVNLYELIKQNGFRGLSTNLVRVFVSQILDAMTILNRAKIIHCDLKPENILLRNLDSPAIKVIDFGSACHENQTVYTYIQSRFYRSPEVILGLPYTSSIDMWSLGCISAELFLGLPLFPGSSEYNQIARIVEMMGVPPPYMIEKGKQAHGFFEKRFHGDGKSSFALKTMEQYSRENNSTEHPSKRYFQGTTLEEVVSSYPITRKGLSQNEVEKEMQSRIAFIDFLRGLLNLNPLERWSPLQARQHPFITGERFAGPFQPSTSRRLGSSLLHQPITQDLASARTRPRANTIGSTAVDRQGVPPQLQRLVALSKGGISPADREKLGSAKLKETCGVDGRDSDSLSTARDATLGVPFEAIANGPPYQTFSSSALPPQLGWGGSGGMATTVSMDEIFDPMLLEPQSQLSVRPNRISENPPGGESLRCEPRNPFDAGHPGHEGTYFGRSQLRDDLAAGIMMEDNLTLHPGEQLPPPLPPVASLTSQPRSSIESYMSNIATGSYNAAPLAQFETPVVGGTHTLLQLHDPHRLQTNLTGTAPVLPQIFGPIAAAQPPYLTQRAPGYAADAIERGFYRPWEGEPPSSTERVPFPESAFDHFNGTFTSIDRPSLPDANPRAQPFLSDSHGQMHTTSNPQTFSAVSFSPAMMNPVAHEVRRSGDLNPPLSSPAMHGYRESPDPPHRDGYHLHLPSVADARPPVPDPGGDAELIPGKRHSLPQLTLPGSYARNLVYSHSSTYINDRGV
ncbi:kinase-like protein [Gonapodya prolifera JEL478]|uniref:Kinase-like protein n=1 Tax=Gonapodya prolifera (strain JEL478) TaxID=1344416 RepID=A0A139AR00_GONPJ|nr:kinase-like protein [Gonapodya prolifera JEL478]|eukprot:KXS19149.1 kinase-like protein [Gonapodya prolifera JEL478]